MNKITKYEWQIVSLFLFSLLVNGSVIQMKLLTMAVFFIIGILFEFLTEPLWNYNVELKKSPFTLPDKDINFLFGLGWLAIVILGLSTGTYLQEWIASPFTSGIIGVTIIGNILESLFFYFGLWTYEKDHPMLRFPPILGKYFEIAKIPLSVRLGYPVLGAGIYYVNQLINQIL